MRHQSGQLGRMDRKRLAVVGAVCFVLLALALRAYMGGGSEEKKKVAHGRPLVKVVTVARADMMRHIALSGQTVADADIPLAPKYTGRITEVRAKLGDEVQAGDVLGTVTFHYRGKLLYTGELTASRSVEAYDPADAATPVPSETPQPVASLAAPQPLSAWTLLGLVAASLVLLVLLIVLLLRSRSKAARSKRRRKGRRKQRSVQA